VLADGPLDQLDHAAVLPSLGGKLGIDGTHKWEAEGARPWPERIEMTSVVRERVAARWPELGIGLD
jgi:4-hydroxy-3-polyprenylbenzoate decarboxylase